MEIAALCGFVLAGASLTMFLRSYQKEYALLVSMGIGIAVLLFSLPNIRSFLDLLQKFGAIAGMNARMKPLLKGMGVTVLTGIAGGCCRDAGQSALAEHLEFAGRCAVFVTAIPLFEEVFELITQLLREG